MAAFVPAYLAFLFVSMSCLDHSIPADFRLLAPVHVALIILATLTVDRLIARVRRPERVRRVLAVVLMGLLVGRCVAATRFVARAGNRGLELTAVDRTSPLLAAVRKLPAGVRVYSNLHAMTTFLADRPVWPITRATYDEAAYIALYSWGHQFDPPDDLSPWRRGLVPLRSHRDGGLYETQPLSALDD
jgi:hypothetical protein